jgi:energy-coupling factor transporter ATP-binding protein EcfA2
MWRSEKVIKIKEIRASAFRGIGKPFAIKLDGKSLVLYGDSGTGKSSLIEALEYALTGKVYSLENRGQRVSFARHGTHVTMNRTNTSAEVVVGVPGGEETICVPRNKTGKSTEVHAFLRGCASGTFVLRRDKILSFIESVDRDRYAALRPFLGIEQFDSFEQILKQAKELADRRKLEEDERLKSAQTEFLRHMHLEGAVDVGEPRILKGLGDLLGISKGEGPPSQQEVRNAFGALKDRLAQFGDTSTHSQLGECRSRAQDYLFALPNNDELDEVCNRDKNVEQIESRAAGKFYEEVLIKGKQWINESDDDICPLCEKPIEQRDVLLRRIQERLEEHSELVSARSDLKRAIAALRIRLDTCFNNHNRASASWSAAGFDGNNWPFADTALIIRSLLNALGDGDRIADRHDFEQLVASFKSQSIGKSPKMVEEAIKIRESALPNREDAQKLLDVQTRCELFFSQFPELLKKGEKVQELSDSSKFITRLYESAVEARKDTCRDVFEEIGDSVDCIYQKFHPDEGLGEFELEVKDVGSGSAVLKGKYPHREVEDPRGLYSEAHLDTLGLAIFLALRKREEMVNPALKLIVLDDILTSVDGPHRERVANFILSEFANDHQMIITTHSRPWFEWIVQLQNSHGCRDKFINKRILHWALTQGPNIVDPEGDYEFLQKQKQLQSHEHLAPIAGRLLESMLQELRLSLRLAVEARRDERYTVGDLWPGFRSTCQKKYKGLWLKIEATCESLNSTIVIRNWETHSNEWAKELSRTEAMQFIDGVLLLYTKVFCQTCGSSIEKCETPRGAASCKKGCLLYLENSASVGHA